MITKKILLGYDVNVTTADNGKKAVELASEGIFDLILMDIQMPVMDGYEATKTIRETLQLNLPIIALSANVMDVDRTLSEQSGMNAHLGKPIKIDELLKTITSFL
jgi:two-component system sensor histidine kinase/response regulator